MRDEQTISDPSFGQIRLGRTQNQDRLYGAHTTSPEVITLSIHPSELIRSLGEDRYYPKNRPIIEVMMTPNQFAEFITSSYSTGVPCTIRQHDGERYNVPAFDDERTKTEQEFNERFDKLGANITRLTETAQDLLQNKKSLTKADRAAILNSITNMATEVQLNMPYMASLYTEQLDKATTEAKADVTSYVESTVRALGLHSLGELTSLRQTLEQDGVKRLTESRDTLSIDNQDEPT